MEYINNKGGISKLIKSVLSIGIFIVLAIIISYTAIFVIKALFVIAIFGGVTWGAFKLIKSIKNFIYKLIRKKDSDSEPTMFSSYTSTSDSIDINYEDNLIIDVDYEDIVKK